MKEEDYYKLIAMCNEQIKECRKRITLERKVMLGAEREKEQLEADRQKSMTTPKALNFPEEPEINEKEYQDLMKENKELEGNS